MEFIATRRNVEDQGRPPESFLTELVEWGRSAPEDIFAPRPDPKPPGADVYNRLLPFLGDRLDKDSFVWRSPLHRRAAMLELMRVHGGFESGWNWNEKVDTTNPRSVANKTGQETGLWQVSFDSEHLDAGGMDQFCRDNGIDTVDAFIAKMKLDHKLAMEYYARLMRYSYLWAGPVKRHTGDTIDPWLSRAAVTEFEALLSA